MKPFQLAFSHRLTYDGQSGITVSVLLSSSVDTEVTLEAKLDTGSDFCVFKRIYAELLQLEIEGGQPQRMRTAAGSVEKASGEQVTLREYLEYVWAAVSKEALNMIFSSADATGFEADARLTAMWLWTLTAKDEG